MDEARLEALFSTDAIASRLTSLADELSASLPPDFALVAILKGSFVFAADLLRALAARQMNPDVDFMILSSYGQATVSSGTVRLLRDVEIPVKNRHVLLVDDILDSGKTLEFARRHLLANGAKTTKVCVLLDKGSAPGVADFAGFPCPDAFVVGYGMDYAHKYRGLPFIAILTQ
ncbi:MAG: phosphoribosyltransferase family protein [Micropepsaceae bacterium]